MKPVVLATLLPLFAAGCSSDDEGAHRQMAFLGDSLVAGWDTRFFFPGWDTTNDGLNGAQIDYIEGKAREYEGRELVLLIGTNNYFNLSTDADRRTFANRYFAAVDALGATHTYIISLLPRDPSTTYGNHPAVNDDLRAFNVLLAARCAAYPTLTFLDVHNVFLNSSANGINTSLYRPGDGLHINTDGYRLLSATVSRAIARHMQ